MANPILNDRFGDGQERVLQGEPMTVNGTLQITLLLGVILLAGAAFTWSRFTLGYTDIAGMLTFAGLILAFILGLVIFYKNKISCSCICFM
jgi:uncharacterized YccA/Bax inhibitor family protein